MHGVKHLEAIREVVDLYFNTLLFDLWMNLTAARCSFFA